MYARTNRCYNEQGSRSNYVRCSIPHCTDKLNTRTGSLFLGNRVKSNSQFIHIRH